VFNWLWKWLENYTNRKSKEVPKYLSGKGRDN